MNILDDVMSALGGQVATKIGESVGISADQAENVLKKLIPAVQSKSLSNIDAGSIMGLLGSLQGNEKVQNFLDTPEGVESEEAVSQGNNILQTLLGGKEGSREVAKEVAGEVGEDESIIKKILPLAAMALGSGATKKLQNIQAGEGGIESLVSSFLDQDGDGSVMDDVADLASKFLR